VTEARLLRNYYAFQLLYCCTFYQAIFFVFYAEAVGLDAVCAAIGGALLLLSHPRRDARRAPATISQSR
jgi:hypothetical protein